MSLHYPLIKEHFAILSSEMILETVQSTLEHIGILLTEA